MPSRTTVFVLVSSPDKVNFVKSHIDMWKNIFVKTKTDMFPVKSIRILDADAMVEFLDKTPEDGAGSMYFEIENMCYHFEGVLKSSSLFTFGNLNQEQKRKFPRMLVPKDYPAYFVIDKVDGKDVSHEAPLLDIHGEGLQFHVSPSFTIKDGEHVTGTIRINKFSPLKVGGTVRHSVTKSSVGVEINHREFGSDGKLMELLAFYQHDVFYFNKKKAANG
jgi:hypothetical protein